MARIDPSGQVSMFLACAGLPSATGGPNMQNKIKNKTKSRNRKIANAQNMPYIYSLYTNHYSNSLEKVRTFYPLLDTGPNTGQCT